MTNQQPISKRDYRDDGRLFVHSIFYTIQGEGPFAGTPAIFVRLNGCNLQCPACDTEYTNKREQMSVEEIIARVYDTCKDQLHFRPLVVITGGEPFRQNVIPLCERLTWKKQFFVQIETNGTLSPVGGKIDHSVELLFNQELSSRCGIYVVVSPKLPKVNPVVADIACAFKYVLSHHDIDDSDGLPTYVLNHMSANVRVWRPAAPVRRPIYLQPMDWNLEYPYERYGTRADEMNMLSRAAVKQSCLKHGYILQLQIHKILGVE